jgi:phosphoribosylamine--glycine ligase
MITPKGPNVVEFNCRFGDPETQAVLPLIQGDFLRLLYSAAEGKIDKSSVSTSDGTAVCVVAVSGGYPDVYQKGFEIKGLNDVSSDQIIIFHAGTVQKDNKILTSGGRVIGITAVLPDKDIQKARVLAYGALSRIKFEGMYFRHDIGVKALNRS